ncbi:unnamed protein product [Paramecium sonneborni]|uniref:Uncharacterized protein n=1 Tax=Paramecium sonneborni TaxID=65129 RepID=A0A8S1MZ94_9CILI|nr:unnamed protein product [Paramecium sonneborni]
MILIDIIILVIQGFFKYVLPILFASFIIYEWPNLNTNQARILMSINVVLIIRLENCFAFYRFYKQKSIFEYEMTIFLTTVKVVNSFQAQTSSGSIYIIVQYTINRSVNGFSICFYYAMLFVMLSLFAQLSFLFLQ